MAWMAPVFNGKMILGRTIGPVRKKGPAAHRGGAFPI